MTQEAGPKSVQGRFDGQIVDYWGVPVRPVRRDGRYFFEYLGPGGAVRASAEVVRTVGSHRYQQYLTRLEATGENHHRLQLLWHNEEQRWMHVNGAFLRDDAQHFSGHVTTWDHNCIFCHNTGPQPRARNLPEIKQRAGRGEPVDALAELRYDAHVAELGVACESCHGPGAEHARRNRDMARRYWLHLTGQGDPTIVNPRKLAPARSAETCGQCHGQRVPAAPELLERWLTQGPTYRPGEELDRHVRLVTAAEPGPPDQPVLYRRRFWDDGTPRLSAYELQGLRQSQCFLQGELSCATCHAAHGGDVNGMMREEGRSNAPCLACHERLAQDVTAHTRHAKESSGSLCYNCHMPRLVYGVMEIHRSHRIEVPDPVSHARDGRPNACNACHLDRSAGWAARARTGTGTADDGEPELFAQLLGGDPVQRAIAADAAGRNDGALSAAQRLRLVPALLRAMEDGYPAVRRFAWRSLKAIERDAAPGAFGAQQFDFIAAPAQRRQAVAALQQQWQVLERARGIRPLEPDAARLAALGRAAALKNQDVNIGE